MKSRERVLKALSHEEPDRVPIDFGGPMTTVEVEAYESLKKFIGIKSKTKVFSRAHVVPDESILEMFNTDIRYVYFNLPEEWNPHKYPENTYVDEWGVTWKMPKGSYYYDPIGHPLQKASIKDLEKYNWPGTIDKNNIARWSEQAKYLFENTEYCVVADATGWGIFEQTWALRGFAQFLMDLRINCEFAERLLDKVLETQKKRFDAYLSAVAPYIHVIVVSDDLSTQDGPIIAPEMYRKIIKPRHRELYQFIKKKTKAKLFHHICGNVIPFIEDLLDVGVDILNPIQVSAKDMEDTEKLKRDFGDRIVFWGGGCDTQSVLPFGSPRDVKKEVKRRIYDLAPSGGFVFAPVHNIQPGVPPENIVALYEAAMEYGVYPIIRSKKRNL